MSGTTDHAHHNILITKKTQVQQTFNTLIMTFRVQNFQDAIFTINLIKVQNQHRRFHLTSSFAEPPMDCALPSTSYLSFCSIKPWNSMTLHNSGFICILEGGFKPPCSWTRLHNDLLSCLYNMQNKGVSMGQTIVAWHGFSPHIPSMHTHLFLHSRHTQRIPIPTRFP